MGHYEQWMKNDPRFLQMMKQRTQMGVPNYKLDTPSLTPNSLQNINPSSPALSSTPGDAPAGDAPAGGAPAGGGNWGSYLGLGAAAASPIATALLGKGAPEPRPPPAASVGSKPIIQVNPNIYSQQQRMPAFLARLLMGAR